MKVLYMSSVEEENLHLLTGSVTEEMEIVVIPPERKSEAIERAGEFDVVIGARIGREFLQNAGKLRYLVIPFAGLPPQDIEVLPEFAHVTVLNSHFNAQYVAEHAWALLLACARKLCPIHEKLKAGDWTPRYDHRWGVPLAGKTLLVLGYGSVGRAVAKVGKAFEMIVKAIKRTALEAPELDFLGTPGDLPTLLPEADFIVVTLPGTEGTKGLLGRREFELMKEGVHIVNVGRGAVIDEDAFYEALESGKVGAAGIDTWWVYPKDKESRCRTFPSKHPLARFDNVVFSPHRASHVSGREVERMRDLAGILDSIARGRPRNVVNLQEGY